MIWKIRFAVLVVCLAGAPCAYAAAHVQGACSGLSVSAQDQYCESIPAPTGHRGSAAPTGGQPGSPTLASELPAGVVREIAKSNVRSPRRRLLTLPARTVQPLGPPASVNAWSLSLIMILILLAIILALAAVAERRRRHRARVAT